MRVNATALQARTHKFGGGGGNSNVNGVDTFALKVMKKKQIIETRQQQHVLSEKNVMLACR